LSASRSSLGRSTLHVGVENRYWRCRAEAVADAVDGQAVPLGKRRPITM